MRPSHLPVAGMVRVALVLLLAASLGGWSCSKKPEPAAPAPSAAEKPGVGAAESKGTQEPEKAGRGGGEVTIAAPESAGPLRATVVRDLAPLKAKADGGGLLAAARFEPEGKRFPEGVDVTWPLASARLPGERLWIVYLDEKAGAWLTTNRRAVVDATGMRATGKVFHFSTSGVSDRATGRDDELTPRATAKVAEVRTGGHEAVKVETPKMQAVRTVYGNTGGAGAPMTKARMKQIYAAGDFHTVKTLIEDGVISKQHSMDMADMRILMCIETFEAFINSEGKKYKVYRSDSGNQNAGMSSDIDQTISVMEKVDGKWVRAEHVDVSLAKEFPERFRQQHGLSVEVLDIATIAGRDRPPEWRTTGVQLEAEGKRSFEQHSAETMFTLRRTPGAYTYCGAIVQQMQLRVLDLIERNLAAGKDTPHKADPRSIHAELSGHAPELRLNNLVCMAIGPGEGADTAVKVREVYQEEAVKIMFDGLKPQLIRGHAYDAAVANYFEFMHHLGDKYPAVKYHLRALDDGLQAIERLKKGMARFEYANLHSLQRSEHLAELLGKDLAVKQWDGHSFLDRWKAAFEISAKLREHHSNKTLNDGTYAETLAPLIREMKGADADVKSQENIEAARAEYDRRCQEFMLHNMIATSEHRIAEFLLPHGENDAGLELFKKALDEGSLRKALKLDHPLHDRKWQGIREEMVRNYAEQARNQLLYSFRELRQRPDVLKMIIDRAEAKGYTPEQLAQLKRVVAESGRNGLFFGFVEFTKFPKTYMRYAQLSAGRALEHYTAKAWEALKSDFTFSDSGEGPRPTEMLKSFGLHGTHARVEAMMAKSKFFSRVNMRLGQAFMQFGTLQGASNVLRTFCESDGDPLKTAQSALKESLLLLFPTTGLVYSSYEAGTDWKQQALVVLGAMSPAGGIIIAVYTIGENGVAIYEHSYSTPLKLETADAIYRGYVGPSLYDFSQEGKPPPFTPADEEKLATHQAAIKQLQDKIAAGNSTPVDARTLAAIGRDARAMEMAREAWKAFEAEDNRWQGHALTGKGEHLKQVVLEMPAANDDPALQNEPIYAPGPLLARVKPIVFYSRNPNEGAVDLTAAALSPAELERMSALAPDKVRPSQDALKEVETQWEYEQLKRRHDAYERAQRYLKAAAANHELKLQIQRDSMYPSMMREKDAVARMFDARHFVDTWIAVRRRWLPEALKKAGIKDGMEPWDARIREELADRVFDDLERSRRLWFHYELMKKAREEAMKGDLDRRKGAVAAEMLMESVRQGTIPMSAELAAILSEVGLEPKSAASPVGLGWGLEDRHVPLTPPEVEVTVRAIERPNEKTKMLVELRHDVKITADPTVYLPPYFSVPYILDPRQAQEALGSRQWMGLPLSDDMVESLKAYVADNASMMADFDPQKDVFTPTMLVFAFCTDQKIPQRFIPETTAELPVLTAYDIRLPQGLGELPKEMRRGYLFGGAAAAPKATVAPSGPLMISTRRWGNNEVANAIEIRSEALAKLDEKEKDVGVKFKLLRARDAAGPWEEMDEYFAGFVFGDTPIRDDSKVVGAGSYRPAKNVFVLKDHNSPVAAWSQKPGDKPVHYQVVQVPIKRSGSRTQETGKEIRSNVASPDGQLLVQLTYDVNAAGEAVASYSGITLNVTLGLKNQFFHYPPKGHAVATVGGRQTHFWGSTRIPTPPEGGEVSVTAESDGASGSASFTLKADQEWLKRISAAVENAKKELAAREKDILKEVEESRKTLERLTNQKVPRPADGSFTNWPLDEQSRITGLYAARAYIEYESKRVLALYRYNVAYSSRDFSAALAIAEGEQKLIDGLEAIEKEERAALQALLNEAKGAATTTGAAQTLKTNFIKGLEARLANPGITIASRRLGEWNKLHNLAYEAGDAAAFVRATEGLAAIYLTNEKEWGSNLANVYHLAAGRVAEMTGDTGRAMEYFNKGIEAERRANPSAAHVQPDQVKQRRPAWWPKDAK